MNRFEIGRADGRSNAQVVIDLVRGAEAGRVFTFAEFKDALAEGTGREYAAQDVHGAVGSALQRLLHEQQRTLHSVRGVGYRLAEAKDHSRLALDRKRRSDVQLRRGYQTLTNVRWDELDPEARKAHEGTLMLVGALYQHQRYAERRAAATEAAIEKVTQRIEALEQQR